MFCVVANKLLILRILTVLSTELIVSILVIFYRAPYMAIHVLYLILLLVLLLNTSKDK